MNFKITPYIYSLLLFFIYTELQAQEFELKIKTKDTLKQSVINLIDYRRFHENNASVYDQLDSLKQSLKTRGYFNNKITNIVQVDSVFISEIELGKKIENIKIFYNKNIFNKTLIKNFSDNYNDKSFVIKTQNVSQVLNELVAVLENQGKTFAQVSLKNITYDNETLSATLNTTNSNQRRIDDIIVNKYDDFPKSHIKHLLNLKKGTTFNTSKLKQASDAIASLPFVSEIKPPEVLFTNDSTSVYLYLEKTKSNKFDGLIGFSSDENGKINFNGYLDLLLNNIFNSGEQFSLNWKSNGEERKIFKLKITSPFIFNSKFSPNLNFDIYKQDSTFLNIKSNLKISYLVNPRNKISTIYQIEKSNDLNTAISSNHVTEFNNSFFGLSYEYKKINTLRPFQNIFFIDFNTLIGKRKNPINNDQQQKFELSVNYNWILNKRNTISIKNTNQLLVSDTFYTNELYRIGGANSIRGFNQESIFASALSILNLEYQYYMTNDSYIYSITDFGYVENNTNNTTNKLFGFGIGYNYQIKSGHIDMSYAIGKESNSEFNFNNSKFHIKLIQFF